MTDTAVHPDEAASSHPAHPLDPATAAEYLAGREVMAAAGLLAEPVRFAYYGLEEPPKAEVLAATAKDRRLRAFLINTSTGESTDVVVSLPDRKVISARRLDPKAAWPRPIETDSGLRPIAAPPHAASPYRCRPGKCSSPVFSVRRGQSPSLS